MKFIPGTLDFVQKILYAQQFNTEETSEKFGGECR